MNIYERYTPDQELQYFYGNLITHICFNFIRIYNLSSNENELDIKKILLLYLTDNIKFLDTF